MVTPESPFRAPARITEQQFVRVLTDVGSPWVDQAAEIYRLIRDSGHDPGVWLAICGREHSFATNRESVLHRNNTNSWTNARSVRVPGMEHEIITDPVRNSQYVRYRSVLDSVRDGMYRVDDPEYVYRQRNANSIAEVLSIWTESEAKEYIAYVVRVVNEWSQADKPYWQVFSELVDIRADLPRRPQRETGAGPFEQLSLGEKRGVVVHYSGPAVGNRANPVAVLKSEAQYHVQRNWGSEPPIRGDGLMYHVTIGDDGTKYLCRDLESVLWHCGVTEWNRKALSVHIPIGEDQRATAAQLRSLGEIVDEWCQFTGTPVEQVWGHQEVSPTSCPGTLMEDFVRPYRDRQPVGGGQFFEETGCHVGGAFWDYWEDHGGLALFGYPLTGELTEACEDGEERTVQYFERAVFEWHPENDPPHKVLLRRLGADALERRGQTPIPANG